jgi:Tol biopolymer transport system component
MNGSRLRASAALAAALVVAAVATTASAGGSSGAIVFSRYDDTGNAHLTITSPQGATEREINLPYPGDEPLWSPNGQKLLVMVFTPNDGVRPATLNPDGSGFNPLHITGLPDGTDFTCHAWSANGQRLLCQAINFNGENEADGVYTVRASDGGDLTRLTVNPYPPEVTLGCCFGGGDIPGGFSPDGKQFVFMRAKPGPDPTQPDNGQSGALYVENTDGTNLHQIAPFGAANSHDDAVERWSPDGKWIVFAGDDFTLQLIRPDGTDQHAVPIPVDPAGRSFAFTPSWSPDGKHIVFSLYRPTPDQEDIYTVRVDGTELTQVTDTPEFEDFASWRSQP